MPVKRFSLLSWVPDERTLKVIRVIDPEGISGKAVECGMGNSLQEPLLNFSVSEINWVRLNEKSPKL